MENFKEGDLWEDIRRDFSFLLNTGGWRRHSRGQG
jgi:hypothetical protein